MPLRLVFMGTPEFAVPTLLAIAAHHDVLAVYTRAPKPAGRRGLELTPSPVEREARRQDIGGDREAPSHQNARKQPHAQ